MLRDFLKLGEKCGDIMTLRYLVSVKNRNNSSPHKSLEIVTS